MDILLFFSAIFQRGNIFFDFPVVPSQSNPSKKGLLLKERLFPEELFLTSIYWRVKKENVRVASLENVSIPFN